MIAKNFLRDVEQVSRFLQSTNFVDLIANCANIAVNAKNGAVVDWQGELEKQVAAIDDLYEGYEVERGVLFIDNSYLHESKYGQLILDYRDAITKAFENIITADAAIHEIVNQVRTFGAHTNQIIDGFSAAGIPIYQLDKDEPPFEDANLVTLTFRGDADISVLQNLWTSSRLLNINTRALGRLDPDAPAPDVIIYSISKASPFEVTVWVTKAAAGALKVISTSVIEVMKKYKELELLREQVKRAKLDTHNKVIESGLIEARAELQHKILDQVTAQLMANYPSDGPNGSFDEVESHARKSAEYFINMSDKGLEIKVIPAKVDIQSASEGRRLAHDYQRERIEADKTVFRLPLGPLSQDESKNPES